MVNTEEAIRRQRCVWEIKKGNERGLNIMNETNYVAGKHKQKNVFTGKLVNFRKRDHFIKTATAICPSKLISFPYFSVEEVDEIWDHLIVYTQPVII